MNKFRLLSTTALGFSLGLLIPAAGFAEQAQPIDVPVQPLAEAITELGKETGLQIAANAHEVEGKQSRAVHGTMTPTNALVQLLAGSGLSMRKVGENNAVVAMNLVAQGALDDEPFDLGTLVLRGERVERDVFNTASSVRAYGAEEIERNVQNTDLERVVSDAANVTFIGPSNQTPFIRGQSFGGPATGAQAAITGQLNRANITVDGRVQTFNELAYSPTSIWDVETIEVFRGPQTTSQGANAIAGAINIRTKDPVFAREFVLRADAGRFDKYGVSLMANTPLSDSVAVRFSFDHQQQDGYINFSEGNNNPRARRSEQTTARLKLLWEPVTIPALSTKLTFSYTEFNRPQTQNVAIDDGAGNFTGLDWEDLVSNNTNGFPSAFYGDTKAVIHDLEYDFGNGISIRNQLTYSEHESTRTTNNPAEDPFPGLSDTWSNEFILDYSPEGGPLSGIFGIFVSETTTGAPSDATINGLPLTTDGTIDTLGIFTEATYDFGNGFDVTAGIRYESNKQDRKLEAPGVGISSDFGTALDYQGDFVAVLPSLTIGYEPSDDLRFAFKASQGFNPGGVSGAFSAIFGTITLPPGVIPFFEFDEETVDSFELSMRGRFLESRLFVGANLFYNDYKDYQFSIGQILPSGDIDSIIGNAEGVESYGLEVDAQFEAADRLRLNGSLGLLRTEVTEFDRVVSPIVGNELPFAPSLTASVGLDFDATERLTIGGQIRYSSGYYSNIDNTPSAEVGSLTTLDLRATYAISDTVELFGSVNNVTDKIQPIQKFAGGTQGVTNKPREILFGVRATF